MEITTTLTNHRAFSCRLLEGESLCPPQPTAEVLNASGKVVWSPRNLPYGCPGTARQTVLVDPGEPRITHITWDLTDLTTCTTRCGQVPAGRYTVRGYSDTVGSGQGVTVTVR